MDEPYFNVIYSWKLSVKTLTNLIDLLNNTILQARQNSLYEHWLDQVSAAKLQPCSKDDENREKKGILSHDSLFWWKIHIHKWLFWAVFWGCSLADGCVVKANWMLHQKGQNPSVPTHCLPLAGPSLWHRGHRNYHRLFTPGIKKSLGPCLFQNKYSITFMFEKRKLSSNLVKPHHSASLTSNLFDWGKKPRFSKKLESDLLI